VQNEEDWDCWSWWGTKEHKKPKQADLLLFGSGGGYAAGAFFGLGGEAYATDVIGIRLVGHLGAFERDELGKRESGNLNVFDGNWANQRLVRDKNLEHGVAHLIDLALTVHMNPKSSFDPYLAVGASHYGYDIQFTDGEQKGGAVYGRIGAGFNWHIGQFFAGMDAGWYPVEIARYRLERVDSATADFDGDGRRGHHGQYDAVSEDIDNHFDPERFTVTGHLGWRF
jgi:hypothetical protein